MQEDPRIGYDPLTSELSGNNILKALEDRKTCLSDWLRFQLCRRIWSLILNLLVLIYPCSGWLSDFGFPYSFQKPHHFWKIPSPVSRARSRAETHQKFPITPKGALNVLKFLLHPQVHPKYSLILNSCTEGAHGALFLSACTGKWKKCNFNRLIFFINLRLSIIFVVITVCYKY